MSENNHHKDRRFVEECWVLRGRRMGPLFFARRKYDSSGTSGSVTFKWDGIPDRLVLGWYHSHPARGELSPSQTDDITMRSWVKAMGRPFLCGIISGSEQCCYCYYDRSSNSKNPKIAVRKIWSLLLGDFFIGWEK